jgi:colanic acid/amylovoran biosynthesis protein
MKGTHQKPLRILIPNATSPKNHGDQAMLNVLITLIQTTYPQASITVHSVDPQLYINPGFIVKQTLYSWAVFTDKRIVSRMLRVSALFVQYLCNFSLYTDLSNLLTDYRNADLILFVGGGYVRSRKGLTQSLNLYMQLMMFKYAAVFRAKKIVAPISVGPFGYKWQERLSAKVLEDMDLVALREDISYSIVQQYGLKNIVRAADHALLTKNVASKNTHKQLIIGFTIRQWLDKRKQSAFETSIVTALEKFARLTGIKIQPILQVDASEYGEDDSAATNVVIQELKNKGVEVLPIKKIHSVQDALTVYSSLTLFLGMRMHSNIFASIQGIPFVAISYEHKSEGIARQLGMEKYCISCQKIESKKLYDLLVEVYTKRKILSKQLTDILQTIQKKETKDWIRYLTL